MSTSKSFLDRLFKKSEPQEISAKTFGNQKQLPIVPIPNLQYSCQTFMEWCTPLLTPEEKQETENAIDQLARPGGPGEKLHESLIEYARQPGVISWLDRFWDTRYLGRRDPIALNANFFFMFPNEPIGQIERAAKIIAQALHYKLELDDEKIPPSLQRGKPLCMNQNKYLFSETRIPGDPQDTVQAPYTKEYPGPSKAEHILVFHNGHLFKMNVIGPSGKPHNFSDLHEGLATILSNSEARLDEQNCIGHLTTKPRAEWAKVRQDLINHSNDNQLALDEIEQALFVICLDNITPKTDQEVTDNLLHGDSANRYFDKSLQFIILKNGSAGINIEHCGLDGTTILNLVDTMASYDPVEVLKTSGAEQQGTPDISQLKFTLDDSLKNEITNAAQGFKTLIDKNATLNFVFEDFGVDRIKTFGVSPDAFAQLSFQLAHYHTKGFIGATYESIATRQYENGRTEAMRVMTPEIFSFIEAFSNGKSKEEKIAAVRTAAEKHVSRAKQCQKGQAPEQHLWELLNIYNTQAKELGIHEKLSFYESPGWLKIRTDFLSTSSAPSQNVTFFGFGATSSECIGIGYILGRNHISAYLSTAKNYSEHLPEFSKHLTNSLNQLADLLGRG